ncbi:solute carrier family 12 member 1-like [Amphiura filiformis]|uniref:solute carrier family 12 member 1-like n=1 Tax=Amphiura filiformis TaxID=82378 RepID=UPI003B22553A
MEMTEKGGGGGDLSPPETIPEEPSPPETIPEEPSPPETILEEPEPQETTPALKKEDKDASAESASETPRKISFTKKKRSTKKKGRFSVKIAEPSDTDHTASSGADSGKESEDGSSSPLKKAMRKVSTPMKGRFHVKTLREKPHRPSRVSSVENGEMSPGLDLEASFDQAAKNQMTVEALPKLAYYRNQETKSAIARQRPTLRELHAPKYDLISISLTPTMTHREIMEIQHETLENEEDVDVEAGEKKDAVEVEKFGWIKGVLVRCLLNIWGVMLFLRLTWIVGQAGIVYTVVIVLMSTVVTTLTSLSMSAICTNGEVKGGGAYYMISRSLGPEFGGSIGLIFSLANAIAVAMYVVGFAETVRDIMVDHGVSMVDPSNDVRIIGEITVVLLLGVTLVGMSWEAKAQIGLLVILLISMANMIIGMLIPPSNAQEAQGFVGFEGYMNEGPTFVTNIGPDFRGETFFSCFSIFFPAATGILAGANISGDLKDAQEAIPKGTLLAIAITSAVYAGLAILIGACLTRETTGSLDDLLAGNLTSACKDVTCEYGLLNDFGVAELISAYGPIVYAGIFAATLSSALASLVSAPKVFQALCKDKIFPKTEFFAKGVGPSDDPKRAFVLAFVIAVAFIAIGELNAIAPLISNFFLMSYALINFSCFSASLAKSPGWRPAFKYYNMWVALVSATMCVGVMFLINWWAAVVTIALVTSLYMYVKHTKPEINWGSSTQAYIYKQALSATHKLNNIPAHVKTFRPQVLVLSGLPECRPALVHFCSHLTRSASLLLCGNVIIGEAPDHAEQILSSAQEDWLATQKIKAFPGSVTAPTLRKGVQSLLQLGGVGKIRPNTVIMGYKNNWQEDSHEAVDDYVGIIHDTFDIEYGLCILRIAERFDVSSALSSGSQPDKDEPGKNAPDVQDPVKPLMQIDNVIKSMSKFQSKMPKGTIDVWWLQDDGGLTLLVPHLLTHKSIWEKCQLRVFAGGSQDDLGREKLELAQMLSKFRIPTDEVEILEDLNKKPQSDTMRQFEELLEPWKLDTENGETHEKFPWKVTPEEIESNKEKTKRHLRVWDLLHHHSESANLIVITLPMPRVGTVSPYMYMCWLEMLSKDLPPMMLMRGNQTSVLTYYS